MTIRNARAKKAERWGRVLELLAPLLGLLASAFTTFHDATTNPLLVGAILLGFGIVLALSITLVRPLLKYRKEGSLRLKKELRSAYLGALDQSFLNPKRG